MFGHGIFTTDGKEWEESRALLRPSFSRSLVGDLKTFESHISKMIARIPRDGSTVDLQELFFMLTLDSGKLLFPTLKALADWKATDFLFGQSTDVLAGGETALRGEKFGEAFKYVTERVGLTARIGKLAAIFHDEKYTEGIKYIHEYVEGYVHKAVEQNKKYASLGQEKSKDESSGYVFLNELAKKGYNERKIQDELLNILLAGRDTTASLLAHLWYTLPADLRFQQAPRTRSQSG